ncbi:NADH-quinone oxidoreductase subunit 5 family protein [Ornithinimicrobium sediminis]|uniref:NADH-quinone oxidoreductase subunit 5 family protein n=1 Tax=Ornithinimicrobium sediminis TaxID=2904603 RepID=UPI001E332454|nr:NADH-quinone oxidoreductase subunit L [Ornithinimicrobium sediminis]
MTSLQWPDLPDLPALPPLPDFPGAAAQYVVAIPLLAALLAFLLGRTSSRTAAWTVVTGAVLTLGAATWQLYTISVGVVPRVSETVGPLALGELTVPLTLSASPLTAITAVAVALVALVVQVYARWYLWYDPRYRQFAATVSLFSGAMLLVVLSGDVVLTLVGWEVMGWCSYLLVGHISAKASARRAAAKALLVTRFADLGFVLGLVALTAGPGSTAIADIVDHWRAEPGTALTVAMLLVIMGVAGKSALVPFQDWLPDAMEGPTPASALIHAATMVAAGTVVLAQLFPLLQASDPARTTLAVLASATTLLAALLAFAQPDLKRLLAWSTVSQVALMLAALTAIPVGEGPDTAVLHLVSHALFKALLFLALGWLAVLAGGTLVSYAVSGVRRYGSVRRPLGIGLLALAGVPPLVGFVSKELILGSAEAGVQAATPGPALIVLAAVGAGAPLTAAYCMRAWLILSRPVLVRGNGRTGEQLDDFFAEPEVMVEAVGVEEAEAAISSPARAGITTLSLLTVVGGVLPLTPFFDVELHLNVPLLVASLLLMAAAALFVLAASRGVRTRDAAARLPAVLNLAAERGLGADTAYLTLVARPTMALARGVTWLDREVLDGYVRAAGRAARLLGRGGERWSPVQPAPSLVLVLAGVLVLAVIGVVLR